MTLNGRTPYPGLRSFRRDESDLFFGREDCVNTMVDRLGETRFLAVLGSSGTGKSSVVRTGLLDALELGLMGKAGSSWLIAECRPGSAPLKNLALALLASESVAPPTAAELDLLRGFLARGPRSIIEWCRDGNLPKGTNLLLLVDQFEELFRYHDYATREETQAIVALLLEAAHSSEFPIYVTITMRSEYLGACALIDGLAEAISRGMVLTPRMTREQCRAAIEGPAGVCGIRLELPLVNRLLNDLASFAPWDDSEAGDQLERLVRRADQLPLLQYTLNRMWLRARERRGREPAGERAPIVLRLSDYQTIGGLSGSLNAHADQLLNELAKEDLEPVVETVFRALVSGSTVADAVRRPMPFSELVKLAGGNKEGVRKVVDTFRMAGCNFLTPELDPNNRRELDEDTIIDISHESLIRQWGKLSRWLEKESRAAQHWRRLKDRMADGDLLQGRELAMLASWQEEMKPTAEWAKRYGGEFDATTAFLDASRRAEQSRRRRTALMRGVVVALVIGIPAILMARQLQLERAYVRQLEDTGVELAKSNAQAQEAAKRASESEQQAQAALATLRDLGEKWAQALGRDPTDFNLEQALQEYVATIERDKQMEEKLKNLEGSSIVPLGPQPAHGVNYANETDDAIEPTGGLLDEVESVTPSRIPGGRLLTTAELYAAFKHNKLGDYEKAGADGLTFVLVDAWSDPKHPTLPAAKRIPAAGRAGDFEDTIQKELWTSLQTLTGNEWRVPIIFFSRDVKHWAGYNGALRAIQMGFPRVYWYRGGIAAWKEAKQPLN